MLISQHAVHLQALQDLYRRCVSREGLPESPLDDPVHGRPGTHAILSRLGLIKHAEEMPEDPQAVLADIIDYLKSLEAASDGLDSAESTESSEATQSGGPSPEPSTPRELPDASEPSIADKWSGPTENYYQNQGVDNHKSAPQHHNHHQHLSLSMGSFPYQDNAGHSHLLEPSSIQQQRYGSVDICGQGNELPSEAMWSLPYNPHVPGLFPYGNREHLMAVDQDGYEGMSQYGHGYYNTFLQR
ncbi:hypothetical protein PISL3812_06344 [Talaromyces islandicus]|uniref:Uncharacterized protein n=1 Tax=Talaromyces islandicus TaxID=28573 RepID=A0A0U1M158_TALIS|nr:hypothetical protein PISL3812_06344 [Talaromyces islandicus]